MGLRTIQAALKKIGRIIMGHNKELQSLIKQAESQGWQVLHLKGGHLKWVSPVSDRVVFTAFSPSDVRAIKNITRELRVSGFITIKQKGKK